MKWNFPFYLLILSIRNSNGTRHRNVSQAGKEHNLQKDHEYIHSVIQYIKIPRQPQP